jgi:hypothetical protein
MRGLLITSLVIIASCGEDVTLPSVEVNSVHFRYFASSSDRIPSGVLDRLEQHRTDILGFLGITSERVINYYRFDRVEDFNRLDRCDESLGCTRGDELFTTLAFDQHELIHAYLSDWQPGFLISEGTAEVFHCGDAIREWISSPPVELSWPAVVGQSPSDTDVYRWGVRVALYLIRTYGPRRFLAYYQTAHQTDDPALFALEFERFWGLPLDQAWSNLLPGSGSAPQPICPCGQQAVPFDGTTISVSALDEYLTIPPALEGQTLVLSIGADSPSLAKCATGETVPLSAASDQSSTSKIALLRLDDDRYYVSFGGAGSITGNWASLIGQDCATAGTLTVPLDANQLAIVGQSPLGGSSWYVGIGEYLWLHRLDAGPFLVNLTGDCSPTSYRTSIDSTTVVGVSTGVLGLTLPSAPNPDAIVPSVIFDIQR